MKKIILLLVLSLPFIQLPAQDIIVKHDGVEIPATVTEIGDTEIKYTMPGRGVVYTLSKSEVFMIKYKNGTKDVFGKQSSGEVETIVPIPAEYQYLYPPVSKTYALGDYFDEGGVKGIVFSVQDEGRHGLIVSLSELSASLGNKAFWLRYVGHDTEWNFLTHAQDMDDGWNNKLKIEDCMSQTGLTWDNFPAFRWCSELGNGWYMPSYNELLKLFMCFNAGQEYGSNFEAQKVFNALLRKAGGKPFSDEYYRSSTEYNLYYAYGINFSGWEKDSNLLTKRGNARVRAIHKF
jgi:hypothetical protein